MPPVCGAFLLAACGACSMLVLNLPAPPPFHQVWDYVAGRADTAGIAGVNANSLGTFLSVCGIPSVKSGGC